MYKVFSSSFTEPFCELSKSLNNFNCTETRGVHNTTLYKVQDPTTNNASVGTFQIGVDMDSYAEKSGEWLQGYNTKNSDIYFGATYDSAGVTSAGTNKFNALYHAILRIENGMMTASY